MLCRYKNRRLIGDDPFYMLSCEEREVHSMYIPATYTEHAGWYTCQARNSAGSATTEAKLFVESMSLFEVEINPNSISKSKHKPYTKNNKS